MAKRPDKYSDKEALARFEAALRGGLNTPPKPLKDIPKSGGKSRSKKQAKKQ
jgi:hypothetical protein